jgi:hypothetical protein
MGYYFGTALLPVLPVHCFWLGNFDQQTDRTALGPHGCRTDACGDREHLLLFDSGLPDLRETIAPSEAGGRFPAPNRSFCCLFLIWACATSAGGTFRTTGDYL